MQLISASNVSVSFAGRTIFEKVNLGIESKQKIALVGPNGAGKSTLLKVLARIHKPDSGDVIWARGLKIGFLAQTPLFDQEQTIFNYLIPDPMDTDQLTRALEWVSKLQIDQFDLDKMITTLSGGWQKKIALAKELAADPDLLFLDEPTNHLDLDSIMWLENMIKSAPFACVTITHDRLFLQRIADSIFDLDPRNIDFLWAFKGTYDLYLEAKAEQLSHLKTRQTVMQNTLRRETEWLRRGAQARQTKQKARIDRAGQIDEQVDDLKNRNANREAKIDFTTQDRIPKKIIELKNVTKSFNDQILFEDFSLIIGGRSRIGLLGKNGAGKSTLIKILMGIEKPSAGQVSFDDKLTFNYFEQSRESLDFTLSVLKNVCPEGDYVYFQNQYTHIRSYLERFLFFGDKVDLPAAKLSGGEQARLRLAQMMLKSAQVLILDEPTNDLDLETLQVLEQALIDYPGAIILVTHDRYFLDQVCDQIIAFEPNETELVLYTGYYQWEQAHLDRKKNKDSLSKPVSSDLNTENKKKSKISFKDKQDWETIEERIALLEMTQKQIEVKMSQTNQAQELAKLSQELAILTAKVEQAYLRWSELESIMNNPSANSKSDK